MVRPRNLQIKSNREILECIIAKPVGPERGEILLEVRAECCLDLKRSGIGERSRLMLSGEVFGHALKMRARSKENGKLDGKGKDEMEARKVA